MPMSPIQLETRIQELLDGSLSEELWPELMHELDNSEEARALYCKHARIHSLLGQNAKGIRALTTPVPTISVQEIIKKRRKKLVAYSSMAAAAMVLLTLAVMQFIFVSPTDRPLTLRASPGTDFAITHADNAQKHHELTLKPGSRLIVNQGTVELNFESGVQSILQAPADITLLTENSIQMREGSAWFNVSKQAKGFSVITNDLNIVDLGTEFGVINTPGGQEEVHVFKGKVQVSARHHRKDSQKLIADEACRVSNVGTLDSITTQPSRFLTTLPDQLPYMHWSFDGDDQLACSGTHPSAANTTTKVIDSYDGNDFQAVEGKFGKAMQATGTCAFIETDWKGIGDDSPRTMAYWIKLPKEENYGISYQTIGWGRFWGHHDLTTNQFYSYICSFDDGTSISGVSLGGHWVGGYTNIGDGEWHHIAHVFTGKHLEDGNPEIYSYVDGEPEHIQRNTNEHLIRHSNGNIPVNTNIYDKDSKPLSLLAHSWDDTRHGWPFQPSMDEIYIFAAALSAEQIQNLYRYNTYEGPQ